MVDHEVMIAINVRNVEIEDRRKFKGQLLWKSRRKLRKSLEMEAIDDFIDVIQ